MRVIDLLENLTKDAKKFRKDKHNVSRNAHLSGMKEDPSQETIDAILVCFINHIGAKYGVDYALNVDDLKEN